AAELAVPDQNELNATLASFHETLDRRVLSTLAHHKKIVAITASGSLAREPHRAIERRAQSADLLAADLNSLTSSHLTRHSRALGSLAATVAAHRPDRVLDARRASLEIASKALSHAVRLRIHHLKDESRRLDQVLSALGPSSVFARGFSMTLDASGKPVTSATSLSPGDLVHTRLHSGSFDSTVEELGPTNTPAADKKTR
ncbi:MAG: exodeoxyribonuclease VII large subunit, partial [Verrucomicrobiales bacterium]|nr:exodeoxyribonuclease VII large subunit [Verrucomicrobiales bacterium]